MKRIVKIAIPISNGRVSPVLDTAGRLLVVTRRRGLKAARRDIMLGLLTLEGLVQSMVELGVDVLLCAALSEPLLRALEDRGIRVQPHLCGEVEAVLQAYRCGRLQSDEFRMPGCWGQHLRDRCCCGHRIMRGVKSNAKKSRIGASA